jgi:hypothetical protein
LLRRAGRAGKGIRKKVATHKDKGLGIGKREEGLVKK